MRAFNAAIDHLATVPTAELERLLTETLDTASHRLDAWITSLATKRLAAMRSRWLKGLLVGAYGWLENVHPSRPPRPPTPATEPAADPGKWRLPAHAVRRPGHRGCRPAQRVPHPCRRCQRRAGRGRPQLPAGARRALALLDGARPSPRRAAGAPVRARLALHVHRAPGDPELDQYIALLRRLYPLAATTDTVRRGRRHHRRADRGGRARAAARRRAPGRGPSRSATRTCPGSGPRSTLRRKHSSIGSTTTSMQSPTSCWRRACTRRRAAITAACRGEPRRRRRCRRARRSPSSSPRLAAGSR